MARYTFSDPEMNMEEPRILKMSKRAKIHAKQLEKSDPLVLEIAEAAAADVAYMEATIMLENGVTVKETPKDCLLRELEGSYSDLGIAILSNGSKVITRNGCEVLIPEGKREEIVDKLHESHAGTDTMFRQCQGKLFWPGLKKRLDDKFKSCGPCQIYHASLHRKQNEISDETVKDLLPGEELTTDFCSFGNENFLVITDRLSGYMSATKTRNQSTEAAVKGLKEWFATFGAAYRVFSDNGPCYRDSFADAMKKLGVMHCPVSAYSPQSNAQAERAVKSLKDVLKRNPNMSDLQVKEMVFSINSRKQPEGVGSPHERFFNRSVRTGLPNSLHREIDSEALNLKRWEIKEKKTKSKERSQQQTFEIEQKVRVQDARTKLWDQTGTITEKRDNPVKTVSYEIKLDEGGQTSRHKSYIMPIVAKESEEISDTRQPGSAGPARKESQTNECPSPAESAERKERPARKKKLPAKLRD